MSAPQTWGPDEWIDPWAPVDRLHQMPILAAQARELGQTRNPDGDRRAQRSHSAGSRPPARLDLIDVADDTTEARGELKALILWCSRPIWEGIDDETRRAHPQPLGTPTWETETEWLAGIWVESRAQLDLVDLQMSSMTLDDTYRALCKAVGLRAPRRPHCPTCGAPCIEQGDMLVCEATRWQQFKHEFPGASTIVATWRRHPLMTAAEMVAELPGLTEDKLKKWTTRPVRVRPVATIHTGKAGRPAGLFDPWHVIRLLWPDIADDVDACDASERAS
jgi:hypothetical protein